MKNKRSKYIIIELLLLIIFFYMVKKNIININILENNHFNLITVNSIFAGFLFSALALIVGLFDDKVLVRLERADFLENIYTKIINGIINSVISIVLSLYNIFIGPRFINITSVRYSFLREISSTFTKGLELFFLIATIVFFILGVKDIQFIIRSVRKRVRSELPKNQAIDKVIEKIEKSQEAK
ncbi:TPA: hypothetical protein ACXNW8_000196 [Clostridium botulinum]